MDLILSALSHGGEQRVYRHRSESTNCEMTFAIYLPPQTRARKVPVLWYLSGLTCNHANVMEKGEYRQAASQRGVIVVAPDTSPRGVHVPDEPSNWQFGSGAGFYLDAKLEPFARNYKMYSYVARELPELIAAHFPADMSRQGVFGHSMGGHGAMVLALRNQNTYRSCSAFAPIVQPSTADWSRPAFEKYLGSDGSWDDYDTVALIRKGHRFLEFLVDQGTNDEFLNSGLRPWLLTEACETTGIRLRLNMREGYDHSYFFISTFMSEHIAWHADRM
jgi:S-formylglutathione hydrolase